MLRRHLLPLLACPALPAVDEYDPGNIKLSHRMPIRSMTDDDLLFLQQLGIRHARVEFGDEASFAFMRATQERLRRFQMTIYSAVHYAYRRTRLQLGQAGRDADIDEFNRFLVDCGKLGIPVANIDWHPANTYTTAEVLTPRGYRARQFKLEDFRNKVEKQAFDRMYTADDIWNTYTYFIRAVLPVAEKADVRLALHPDDPPLAMMNGVAKLFVHYDGYRRAEQIAGASQHWGLTFCIGTWSEGGTQMGKDVFAMIRDFGGLGKIFDVHFRNVSSPLPEFVETFPDDGYQDMAAVMRALREVKFRGAAQPDHIPLFQGDDKFRRAGVAYAIANMRSLLREANR
ncbi:MAG: mannonate dehydratase [Bryobacteraceae bacterium]|nr:mannonate dehydratase [Bryobacteraceae bacterium]